MGTEAKACVTDSNFGNQGNRPRTGRRRWASSDIPRGSSLSWRLAYTSNMILVGTNKMSTDTYKCDDKPCAMLSVKVGVGRRE
jgi:hypothetical protein